MRRPDFFIVGAPKAGTTALWDYLRGHPQIFMADTKELHFFGSDLRRLRLAPLTVAEYESYFRGAADAIRVGEASVRYLQSRCAAREIADFSPGARAIIMLRDPVDLMHSLHAEMCFRGEEVIPDFEEALQAEPDRRRGLRTPPAVNIAEILWYRDTVQFSEQVQRYLDVLGPDRVHVIVYDDFRANTLSAYRETLRFLGVDQTHRPDLRVVNPSKRPRSRRLQAFLSNPPSWARVALRATLPRSTRTRLFQRALRINARVEARQPIPIELRERLSAEMTPEIERLERLLGRRLDAWKVHGVEPA